MRRRVDKLVEDELAEEVDGLVYLPRHLADGEGLRPDPHQLEPVALTRGTADLGERLAANGTAISGAGTGSGSPNARSTRPGQSNPVSISSSATVSSAASMARSVCGIVRAASAMTYASRASVLASPG